MFTSNFGPKWVTCDRKLVTRAYLESVVLGPSHYFAKTLRIGTGCSYFGVCYYEHSKQWMHQRFYRYAIKMADILLK